MDGEFTLDIKEVFRDEQFAQQPKATVAYGSTAKK
jgi:hypothetical protein